MYKLPSHCTVTLSCNLFSAKLRQCNVSKKSGILKHTHTHTKYASVISRGLSCNVLLPVNYCITEIECNFRGNSRIQACKPLASKLNDVPAARQCNRLLKRCLSLQSLCSASYERLIAHKSACRYNTWTDIVYDLQLCLTIPLILGIQDGTILYKLYLFTLLAFVTNLIMFIISYVASQCKQY